MRRASLLHASPINRSGMRTKKNPDKLNTCRGSHFVCIAGGGAIHTQCLKCTQKVYVVKLLCVYSALAFASAIKVATRLRSRSSAFASNHWAMAWSACSSCALMVDSALHILKAVALMPRSLI